MRTMITLIRRLVLIPTCNFIWYFVAALLCRGVLAVIGISQRQSVVATTRHGNRGFKNYQIKLHLVFSLLLSLSALHAEPETTRIEFYYGIAQGNYLIGDLEGASSGVEQMLKLDPEYTPALTLKARILLDQNKPELALESAQRAIELEPDNTEHLLLKTLLLGNLGRREEAILIAEKVMQLAPVENKHHRVASKLLGLLLMAEGNLDQAAEVFNKSYLDNPETAQENLMLAGEAYLQKIQKALAENDFGTAVEAIDQALEQFRSLPGKTILQQRKQFSMLRAQVLAKIGRTREAIETLQAVIRQQPDELEALITLAALSLNTENWNLLQEILPDISAQPEFQDIALYLKGRIALHNDRVGTARETFDLGLRIVPESTNNLRASMQFYRGVCLVKLNRIEKGDAEIIQSVDNGFRPETEEEVILVSHTLLRNQQVQRAATFLEAITLNQVTDSPEAWNLLGRAHSANGSPTLSLSAFNQSLSIQPLQSDVLALRGSILRKMGDLEGALSDLKKAIDLNPENPAFTYSLGLIYLQTGNLKSAEHWIDKSVRKLPGNPGIQLLHACLAYNMKAYEKARIALEAYLSRVPKKTNESAFYLEYALIAQKDHTLAADTLNQRIETSDASPLLKNFLKYIRGTFDQKAVLDAAGYAETPEIAQQQICEAAYWLAQHEHIQDRTEKAKELLKLAIQIGLPDYPEYQFAQWQLR